MPDIKIKLTHPKAKEPVFSSKGAACFDLYAVERNAEGGKAMIYSTGFNVQIPEGYHVEVFSRSGHGFRDDMRLCNCVGIIDSDYRGEIKVKLTHDGLPYMADWPRVGDRVAQAKLVRNVKTTFTVVDELNETDRGESGFGSTGK